MTTRSTVVHPSPSGLNARRRQKPGGLPDPPRDPDAMQQIPFISVVLYILKEFFADCDDVLVAAEGYLCQEAQTRSNLFVPDCIFARGVDPDTIVNIQNGYAIDDVGKPPDFVLEVASASTGALDYTRKRDGYAELGVVEYWRFDPSGGEYHDQPLAGDFLVEGAYQPTRLHHEPDGSIWGRSAALGLDLYWREGQLRFYDYASGEFLPEYAETKRQRDTAMEERDMEISRRQIAETRAATAETRAEAEAEARMKAEAELERLRERLNLLDG